MFLLLERLESISNVKIILIRAIRGDSKGKFETHKDSGSSWITKIWASSSEMIIKMYYEKGLKISLTEPKETADGYIEDCLLIKRM